jgi:hypothetical protein
MADHADHHHHAAAEKPNASTMMGFGLFFGIAAVLLALVASVRGGVLLDITGILGVVAIAVAVLAVIVGKAKGWPTRGFAAVLLMGVMALATWAVVGVWIGA